MRSSTFSSELADAAGVLRTPPATAELTRPTLPGGTRVDPHGGLGLRRQVPALPWPRLLLATFIGLFVLMLAWEAQMRHLGLRAGDLGDGRDHWAAERRKVDSGPRDSVVILGDSRILYGTHLATWQKLTGRQPIQLALPATSAQEFLHDLAVDEHFAGLVLIGTAEGAYFHAGASFYGSVLAYTKAQSPSQRAGHEIYKEASRYFAFLDADYRLFPLIEQNPWPERKGVFSPYQDIWKISESSDDRQTFLWDRIARDTYLREHIQRLWTQVFDGEPLPPEMIESTIATTKADVDRIRARGGEVVWVRPPSASPILDNERLSAPRDKVWDRLLHDTGSFGIHFEDYPQMQRLTLPDWSHLSRESAVIFTDAYVRVLLDRVPWLKAHPRPVQQAKAG